MRITLDIPDAFAQPLLPPGANPADTALEALAIEAYRQRRLTGFQIRSLLGIPSRYELDAFLKKHDVYDYTVEDFESDLATISRP